MGSGVNIRLVGKNNSPGPSMSTLETMEDAPIDQYSAQRIIIDLISTA